MLFPPLAKLLFPSLLWLTRSQLWSQHPRNGKFSGNPSLPFRPGLSSSLTCVARSQCPLSQCAMSSSGKTHAELLKWIHECADAGNHKPRRHRADSSTRALREARVEVGLRDAPAHLGQVTYRPRSRADGMAFPPRRAQAAGGAGRQAGAEPGPANRPFPRLENLSGGSGATRTL